MTISVLDLECTKFSEIYTFQRNNQCHRFVCPDTNTLLHIFERKNFASSFPRQTKRISHSTATGISPNALPLELMEQKIVSEARERERVHFTTFWTASQVECNPLHEAVSWWVHFFFPEPNLCLQAGCRMSAWKSHKRERKQSEHIAMQQIDTATDIAHNRGEKLHSRTALYWAVHFLLCMRRTLKSISKFFELVCFSCNKYARWIDLEYLSKMSFEKQISKFNRFCRIRVVSWLKHSFSRLAQTVSLNSTVPMQLGFFFKCDKNTLTCPLQQLTGVPRVAACGVRRRKFNSIRQFPDSAPRAPHRPGFWPTCVSTPTLFRWRISCESGLRTFFACDLCWLDFCVRKHRYFD